MTTEEIELFMYMSVSWNLISWKIISFWGIPIFTNYGFRVVRKKKEYHIPDAASEPIYDADEHLKYSDYRADGIWYSFFFRLYQIYKSEYNFSYFLEDAFHE